MTVRALLSKALGGLLRKSRLALLPVRVRSGIAAGARWSLYPWSAYWRGRHEPACQAFLATLWDWDKRRVWDLGSHYGLYTVGLALRGGPEGAVAAFEPNPVARARLELHLRRNRLSRVLVFPYAVSDKNSTERFLSYGGFESTTAHLLYSSETWHENIPTLDIETRRLDSLVDKGALFEPDFIKMDVEGHGHRALAGAEQTLKRARPLILAALHNEEEAAGVIAVLQPLGYTWQRIDGGPTATLADLSAQDVVFRPPQS